MEGTKSSVRFVTEDTIPYMEAFLQSERFMLLNMFSGGIWLVDTKHSKWEEIKQTALDVAKTFGDTKTIEKLSNWK